MIAMPASATALPATSQAVGRTPDFYTETLSYAYDIYGRKLIVALSWLHGLKPIRIDNLRCLASLYDLCVQQGSLAAGHPDIGLSLWHLAETLGAQALLDEAAEVGDGGLEQAGLGHVGDRQGEPVVVEAVDGVGRSHQLAAETARSTAEATIQMHGGMGMSVEVPATRLAQRLLASGFRYGDRAWHTASLLTAASHP